jgi:hypothetical protein
VVARQLAAGLRKICDSGQVAFVAYPVARYRRIVEKEKRSPDDLLVPEQFPELNVAFYATKPWEYFDYRNHLLMLAAGASDRLVEIAEDGVTYKA